MTWLSLGLGFGLGLAMTKSFQSSEYSTYSATARADERRRTAFQATEAGFSKLLQPILFPLLRLGAEKRDGHSLEFRRRREVVALGYKSKE